MIEPLCPVCGDLMDESPSDILTCWTEECALSEIAMSYQQRLRIIDLLDALKNDRE